MTSSDDTFLSQILRILNLQPGPKAKANVIAEIMKLSKINSQNSLNESKPITETPRVAALQLKISEWEKWAKDMWNEIGGNNNIKDIKQIRDKLQEYLTQIQ